MAEPATTARLLIAGPDRPGLVAAVASFVADHGGNIVHADQHTDAEAGYFFQRIEFLLAGLDLDRSELAAALRPVTEPLGMRWTLRFSDEIRPVGIGSRQAHCLYDLLSRAATGDLPGRIVFVASNHPDHGAAVERFGVPFHHLPVTGAGRAAQERAVGELFEASGAELLVLARYMQILSEAFVTRYPSRIVNIHHSFLPAFVGARPYHQAHERGVKLIGVTAHYATAELDQGPIIEQDVARVTHRDDIADLIRIGRDLETVVLARAVRAHLTDRILVHGRKTVVFT